MLNQYFHTTSLGAEKSAVLMNDHTTYDYLLKIMINNFGFQRYIEKNGMCPDQSYLIQLNVSQQVLDRHLDADVVKHLATLAR